MAELMPSNLRGSGQCCFLEAMMTSLQFLRGADAGRGSKEIDKWLVCLSEHDQIRGDPQLTAKVLPNCLPAKCNVLMVTTGPTRPEGIVVADAWLAAVKRAGGVAC